MYKTYLKLFFALLITVATTVFWHAPSYGQSQYTVPLSPEREDYNLNARTYLLKDYESQLTIQDVTSFYNNNELSYRNTNPDGLLLDHEKYPTWLVFSVQNNTNQSDWYIDIGDMESGRSGIAEKFLIYEIKQRKIFYDGYQIGKKDNPALHEARYIPVTITPGEKAVFLMYILPTDYKRIHLRLSLRKNIPAPDSIIANSYAPYIPYILISCFAILLTGFLITRGVGFIPLLLYYLAFTAWYMLIEKSFYSNLIGIGFISSFYPILNATLITAAAILTIPVRYNTSLLRVILMAVLGFTLTITLLTAFAFPINTTVHSCITSVLSIFTMLTAILYLASNNTYFLKPSALCLAGWISIHIMGQGMKLAYFLGYMEPNFFSAHADYAILVAQTPFIIAGVLMSVKSDQNRRLYTYIRQAEKAKAILNARKSKENSDNTRLLRVIEREREVMEELRNRESERAEEMRKAKIVADEANQAKSAFLAVVSHEIRTPMTGVMGMVRMLQDTDLSPEQKDYLMTVKDSGDAMLALLNDILDFSKIEDGGMSLENIEFDLRRVLNGVQMLMKGHADQKGIGLRINIHENVPTMLYGDPTRLRQVFLNLVGNALKFTTKGHVAINAFLDPADDANKTDGKHCAIYFSVEDTGVGIAEEAQEKLFAPFSQADSTISRKYGGTGLGLSICKRLVEAMEGEIKLRSREGSGTTFFFTLPFDTTESISSDAVKNQEVPQAHHSNDTKPATPAATTTEEVANLKPAPAPQNNRTPTSAAGRKRFLIADDNEINRKVVRAFLEKAGYDSVIIYSGKEALNLLKTDKRFDAIFLDIEMPDMNGREVARAILRDTSVSSIPIIALTGNIGSSDLNNYREIGFKGYVAKPIEPDNLLNTIENLINDPHYSGFAESSSGSQTSQSASTATSAPQPAQTQKPTQPSEDTPVSAPAEDDQARQNTPPERNTHQVNIIEDNNVHDESSQATSPEETEEADSGYDEYIPVSGKTLDDNMVRGLIEGLGEKQTLELLKDLFDKSSEILSGIRKAVSEDDMVSIKDRAHELKGMAGNFGLKAVSDKARQLESITKNGDISIIDLATDIDDLSMLMERSQIALSDYFSDDATEDGEENS